MEGKRKARDVRAVLGCSSSIEGQTNWSLASSFGDGLRNASVVAPREDAAIELKAHDDPREVEAQIRRAQAAHDAVIAKRLEVATALNAKQSRLAAVRHLSPTGFQPRKVWNPTRALGSFGERLPHCAIVRRQIAVVRGVP